mmetsp:Transcript_9271/g.14614  ORF Transcript_9271/g.14614 Transcript_9271/m.14614 type:complete len:133 (-) Transcript_9271:157-555(-)
MDCLAYGFGEQQSWHSLVAGGLGGSLAFSEFSSVNLQVNLYLLSRVLSALWGTLSEETGILVADDPQRCAFPLFGAVVWALALWLLDHAPSKLQPSLRAAMEFVFHEPIKGRGKGSLLAEPTRGILAPSSGG